MERRNILLLLVALAALGGCGTLGKRASVEAGETLGRKVAAEGAAREARQLAAQAERARLAHDLEHALVLERERDTKAKLVDDIATELREASRKAEDAGAKRQLEAAAEETATAQGDLLALRLEGDTEQDVERITAEEEETPGERCRKAVEGLLKKSVCLNLKTYVKEDRLLDDEELWEKLSEGLGDACLPPYKTPRWIEKAKTLKSLRDDIAAGPTYAKKFEIAAVRYGCDLR